MVIARLSSTDASLCYTLPHDDRTSTSIELHSPVYPISLVAIDRENNLLLFVLVMRLIIRPCVCVFRSGWLFSFARPRLAFRIPTVETVTSLRTGKKTTSIRYWSPCNQIRKRMALLKKMVTDRELAKGSNSLLLFYFERRGKGFDLIHLIFFLLCG